MFIKEKNRSRKNRSKK